MSIQIDDYSRLTVLQLLLLRKEAAEKLQSANDDEVAFCVQILTGAGIELAYRGRCSICGLKHIATECQRITGISIEGA